VRFLLDENVPLAAAAAMRERGFDTLHVVEAGLQGRTDHEVVEAAIADGRVVVTQDYRDFSVLADALHLGRRDFPGILFVSGSLVRQGPGALAAAVERLVTRTGGLATGGTLWLSAE
jgi:hypothetical protein